MDHKPTEFTVLKKHEDIMESSIHGKMIELYQLCQNISDQRHYYTYEVLGNDGDSIGGRLIYEFKDPNQALAQWNDYVDGNLKPSSDFTIIKQELFPSKRLRF